MSFSWKRWLKVLQGHPPRELAPRLASRTVTLRGIESLEDRVMPAYGVAYFVNGFGGADYSDDVRNHVIEVAQAYPGIDWDRDNDGVLDIYITDWNSPNPRERSPNPSFGTDAAFVNALSSELGTYRKEDLVLVFGHSFGGDSVLKVANRRSDIEIDLLAVLDPVGAGGLRGNFTTPQFPVKYFFNRWQENAPFPNNFGQSGRIGFNGTRSIEADFGFPEQDEQSEQKRSNGETFERTATAFDILWGAKLRYEPPSFTYPLGRVFSTALHHANFPDDDYIDHQLITIIDALVPKPPVAAAVAKAADGTVTSSFAEGDAVTLDGLGSTDPNPGDMLSFSWRQVGGPRTVAITNPNERVAGVVAPDDGVYSFELTVSDGRLGDSATVSVTVGNVAPTLQSVVGPDFGVRTQPYDFTATFTDPGLLDTHTIRWDYGDGTVVNQSSGSPATRAHAFTDRGNYVVRVRVTDDDGGASGTLTRTVTIKAAGLVFNPTTGLMDLLVAGTNSRDELRVKAGANPGEVAVFVDGALEGTFTPTGDILLRGFDGIDELIVDYSSGRLPRPVKVEGGGGDDSLRIIAPTAPSSSLNTWTVSGANAGGVNGDIQFQSVESLTGGNQADRFVFAAGGSVGGTIDGGGGTDALDFAALAAAQTAKLTGLGAADGFDGAVPGGAIGNGFRNINALVGSAAATADGLAGLDTNSTWTHTGTGGQYLDDASGRTLAYSNFETLNGGGARDTFNIRQTAVNPLAANGGKGDDIFHVSSDAGADDNGNLDGIASGLTIDAGSGTANRLVVSDFGGAANANVVVTDRQITGLAPAAITYAATNGAFNPVGTEGVVLRGSNAGGDTFNVRGALAGSTVRFEGNGGADTLNFAALADAQAVALTGLGATDGFDGTMRGGAVAGGFRDMNTLVGSAAAGDTLTGRDADSTWTVGGPTDLYKDDGSGRTIAVSGFETRNAGSGRDTFLIQADGLGGSNTFKGNGGADAFVVNVGAGVSGAAFAVSGGAGADALRVNARAGDDRVTARVTDPTGGGALAGLGQVVGFDTVENVGIDGGAGTNSLAWVDDTDRSYGTAAAPESGVIVRPLGRAGGDVRVGLGGTVFPAVGFTNINGNFTVSGDGNGSGDKDTLTVLAPSTAGAASAWGELATANGKDAITVTDRLVLIENAAAGALRSVALGEVAGRPTFGTLLVRGGAEPIGPADAVTATATARLQLLVDAMNPPKNPKPIGDNLKVVWTAPGRDTLRGLPPIHQALADNQGRFVVVTDAAGASVGFTHFEGANLTDPGIPFPTRG